MSVLYRTVINMRIVQSEFNIDNKAFYLLS